MGEEDRQRTVSECRVVVFFKDFTLFLNILAHSSPTHSTLSNGYHGDSSSNRSPNIQRRPLGVGNSPR